MLLAKVIRFQKYDVKALSSKVQLTATNSRRTFLKKNDKFCFSLREPLECEDCKSDVYFDI